MHNYLQQILINKKIEIENIYRQIENQPDGTLARVFLQQQKFDSKKSLKQSLLIKSGIIAEVKRKSPSKNHLADIVDPVDLAKKYVKGGARAISVLTDQFGFNGSLNDLTSVATALKEESAPILRKDFILDSIQIAEAIVAGADVILLIVTALKDKTPALLKAAKYFGIEALVEVNNREELEFALSIGAEIIGVNNRNLSTFEVNIKNAVDLIQFIPSHVVSIAASGVDSPECARNFLQMGFNGVLIGEALVKTDDPTNFIRQCFLDVVTNAKTVFN